MVIPPKEIIRDSEIREVRKQLGKLARQARRRGSPLTDQQKIDLLQQRAAHAVEGSSMSKANKPEMDQPIQGPIITEYCGQRNLRRLSAMIVTQAIKDLKKKQDPNRAVSALLWITDPRSDFSLYLETADMGHVDIFKLLSSGNARRL